MQDNRVQPSAGWCSPGQSRAVQDGAGVMVQEDTAQRSVAQHSTEIHTRHHGAAELQCRAVGWGRGFRVGGAWLWGPGRGPNAGVA